MSEHDHLTPSLHRDLRPIVQIEHYARNLNTTEVDKLYQDDAVWIITSSFIIFTMHSGFGLLESGSVSAKDEVNIMVKNVVDVVFGGIAYWSVGYGLSYGDQWFVNPVVGLGKFFYDPSRHNLKVNEEGWAYASFLFQMSLATTASTIVSGAVAERAKLKSYILLGCLVIIVQALPAHWVWDVNGFFFKLGVVDFAGCSAVHMVGGIIGLVATIYLKPRRNRFNEDSVHQMSSPTNALLGTFLLWWGWFGINAGSVWGITDGRWRLGGRAAVATIMSSIGGGATSIVISFAKTKKLQVNHLINGILSSIVSITALCAVSRPWHALIIGSVSAGFSIAVLPVLDRFKIDDPVGIVPIHLTSSIWGMFAVGIFAEEDRHLSATGGQNGLLYGGGLKLMGIQMLATITILTYSAVMGLLILVCISKSPLGLRVTDYEEQIGADVIEHGLAGTNIARYLVEKPLSTKTFQTVTKAITKWKMLAKAKSRQRRMDTLRLKREQEEAGVFTFLDGHANGGLSNGSAPTGDGTGPPPPPPPNGNVTGGNGVLRNRTTPSSRDSARPNGAAGGANGGVAPNSGRLSGRVPANGRPSSRHEASAANGQVVVEMENLNRGSVGSRGSRELPAPVPVALPVQPVQRVVPPAGPPSNRSSRVAPLPSMVPPAEGRVTSSRGGPQSHRPSTGSAASGALPPVDGLPPV